MENKGQWKEWFEIIGRNLGKVDSPFEAIERIFVVEQLVCDASRHLSVKEFDHLREALDREFGMEIKTEWL